MNSASPAPSRPSGPSSFPVEETELLAIEEEFREIEHHLNQLCEFENRMGEPIMLDLQRKWEETCLRSANVQASTIEGLRVKASMLLTVLEVLVPETHRRELHDLLAESLARDLLG